MFKSLHRALRNVVVGQDASGKDIVEKKYYTREVEYPESVDDLIEIGEGTIKLDWSPGETVEITVGYKEVDGKWERVYKTLPYCVAMAIEGMKLDLNQIITPKATDIGVTDADVEAYEKAGDGSDKRRANALLLWQNGSAKVRKEIKESVLKWQAEQKA